MNHILCTWNRNSCLRSDSRLQNSGMQLITYIYALYVHAITWYQHHQGHNYPIINMAHSYQLRRVGISRTCLTSMWCEIAVIYQIITLIDACHQMETFSVLLALCVGNPPVSDAELQDFPWYVPEQTVKKRWRRWWFETPWRQCDAKSAPFTLNHK